jgi:hypothetical protein
MREVAAHEPLQEDSDLICVLQVGRNTVVLIETLR